MCSHLLSSYRKSCIFSVCFPAQVCLAAAELGNKNRRRNTSLMVRYLAPDGRLLNILIDAGKYDSPFLSPHHLEF